MAKDVERLVLELSADISRLDRGMKAGQAIAERRTRAIERSFDQMNQRTSRSVSDMGANIRNTIAGIALGVAVREVQQYADAWTRMGNPLRAAGLEQAEVNARMDELVGIALRSRSSLEGTVTLYNRLIAASGELGVSQERVARVVETVNKALATSNLTASERASATTQLAQGLGSGNLQGDELRAIRENSQVLAQAIADEFGVTIGELKKLGAEGELTAARVFKAIENAQAGTDAAFARTTATISDSFTNLQTRATQYIGQLDAATGASEKFGAVVGFVANNLDAFGDAAVVAATVVGGALAGRAMLAAFTSFTALQAQIVLTNVQLAAFEIRAGLATGALGRMTVAGVAGAGSMRALSGAMAFFGGPIGLAITAVAAAIALITIRANEASRANQELRDTMGGAKTALDAYEAAAIAAANATGKNAAEAVNNANAMRLEAAEAVRSAIALRQRTAALAADAAQRASDAEATRNQRANGPFGRGFDAVNAAASGANLSAKAAQDRADAAAAAARDAERNLNRITETLSSGGYRNPGAAGGGGGSGNGAGRSRAASGPSPEELAAMREQIRLQGELDIAQARGDEAAERRIQREIDINSLTEQMTRAQIEGARALATAQVDSVIAAENLEKQIDDLLKASERRTEARVAQEEALRDEMERQLNVQVQLARIEGNEALVRVLERELSLRQSIAALGPTATPEQVAAVTRDETRLNSAEDQAILRERGADMARSFVDIIRSDDIGAEIGNRFRQAAFDKLEDVIGRLFSQIFAPQQGGGMGGGSWWAQAAAAVFGGGRALGGPVKAGMAYRVNENTPNSEIFVPDRDGWVGNAKSPKAQGKGVTQISIKNDYHLEGAAGTEVILGAVQRMQAASERRILSTVEAAAPNAQLQRTLLKD